MTADDLAKILDMLGQRLGPTGQYVFGLAVRQVYIDAATSAVFLIGWVLLGLVVGPRLYRYVTEDGQSAYSSRDIGGVIVAVVYGLVGIMVLLVAAFAIPAVLNPEYAAIRDILSHLPKP